MRLLAVTVPVCAAGVVRFTELTARSLNQVTHLPRPGMVTVMNLSRRAPLIALLIAAVVGGIYLLRRPPEQDWDAIFVERHEAGDDMSTDELLAGAQPRIDQAETAQRIAPDALDEALVAAEQMQWEGGETSGSPAAASANDDWLLMDDSPAPGDAAPATPAPAPSPTLAHPGESEQTTAGSVLVMATLTIGGFAAFAYGAQALGAYLGYM